MKTNAPSNSSDPTLCRLRLRGPLSDSACPDSFFTDWLTDVRAWRFAGGDLLVEGCLADQSALYGLLSFLRERSLTLVSVEIIPNSQGENIMNKHLIALVCKAVALAMGVAVTVLSLLGSLDVPNAVRLLGLGLAALALASLSGFDRKAA